MTFPLSLPNRSQWVPPPLSSSTIAARAFTISRWLFALPSPKTANIKCPERPALTIANHAPVPRLSVIQNEQFKPSSQMTTHAKA